MEYTDKGYIKREIKPIVEWHDGNGEGCFVSNKILKEGWKVGYMYREAPDEGRPDSGWRFLKGDESDEYMDDVSNTSIVAINTLCNYDPEVIPFLDDPIGSAFIRISKHDFEEDKRDKPIFFMKQDDLD